MLYSRLHVMMGKTMKRLAERDEKKGEDASGLRALYHEHMFLAYMIMSHDTDFELSSKLPARTLGLINDAMLHGTNFEMGKKSNISQSVTHIDN